MAEGAPLLREYGLTLIEGSNPSLSAILNKPRKGLFYVAEREALLRAPCFGKRLDTQIYFEVSPWEGYKMTNLIRNALICLIGCSGTALAGGTVPAAPNGIALPEGYQDWKVISSSHREDNKTLRVILGNDVAIRAARSGETNPWPDGSILGKLVWKDAVQLHFGSFCVGC